VERCRPALVAGVRRRLPAVMPASTAAAAGARRPRSPCRADGAGARAISGVPQHSAARAFRDAQGRRHDFSRVLVEGADLNDMHRPASVPARPACSRRGAGWQRRRAAPTAGA
ncbi:unnamed protein product, partial [Prorocentrum cordatum]